MFKSIDKWLPGYVRSVWNRPQRTCGLKHLIFCVADHFEPLELLERPEDAARGGYQPTRAERLQVVRDWVEKYPEAVSPFRDSDGIFPRHTFFCAPNDYAPDWMEMLAGLCRRGCGEVELHLHHRNDTAEGLAQKLCMFRDALRREHGLLGRWGEGSGSRVQSSEGGGGSDIAYGFIHGNWALCNSRPDGDWCGVNDELTVLSKTGCYADFTFPSAPSPTQPRMVNVIYRAGDTGKPLAHDRGVRCEVAGVRRQGGFQKAKHQTSIKDRSPALTFDVGRSMLDVQLLREDVLSSAVSHPLMLIQGPLTLDWHRRKWGILPRLDNGGITHHNPPTPQRIDLWVEQGIHVRGRPEWIFVKVYTHGCVPSSSRIFLGEAMRRAHMHLQTKYNDGKNCKLHYVTARELYNIVRAAEDGMKGSPGDFRDYAVLPPPV